MGDGIRARVAAIRGRERALAAAAAAEVIPPPELRAFALLFPPALVAAVLRVRGARAFVARNALVTKELALGGAERAALGRETGEEFRARADRETRAVLARDLGGVYADSIRLCQLAEIDLLFPHYRRLLDAPGRAYRELVREAYGSASGYAAFAGELVAAEEAVVAAARDFLGARADGAFADRLAAAFARVRRGDVEFVFGRG